MSCANHLRRLPFSKSGNHKYQYRSIAAAIFHPCLSVLGLEASSAVLGLWERIMQPRTARQDAYQTGVPNNTTIARLPLHSNGFITIHVRLDRPCDAPSLTACMIGSWQRIQDSVKNWKILLVTQCHQNIAFDDMLTDRDWT